MRDAVQEAAGYVRRLFPLFSEDLKPPCGWTLTSAFAKPRAPGEILPRHSGRIAQLVEQLTLNQRVQGSSPCAPTNLIDHLNHSSREQPLSVNGAGAGTKTVPGNDALTFFRGRML